MLPANWRITDGHLGIKPAVERSDLGSRMDTGRRGRSYAGQGWEDWLVLINRLENLAAESCSNRASMK